MSGGPRTPAWQATVHEQSASQRCVNGSGAAGCSPGAVGLAGAAPVTVPGEGLPPAPPSSPLADPAPSSRAHSPGGPFQAHRGAALLLRTLHFSGRPPTRLPALTGAQDAAGGSEHHTVGCEHVTITRGK